MGTRELAKAVEELGAGEILLNCIDCDDKYNSVSFNYISLYFLFSVLGYLRKSGNYIEVIGDL